jgi:nickel superoxide dismutase
VEQIMLKNFIKPVYAHCDIPCGIYETDTMVHSAETCRRMIQRIEDLKEADKEKSDDHNNFIRSVMNKEVHAQKVKQEVYILWSDYFKPEHLEKFPDLHDTLWNTAKQASKVKQSISMDEADKLVQMVADVANIFAESKK